MALFEMDDANVAVLVQMIRDSSRMGGVGSQQFIVNTAPNEADFEIYI